MASPGGASRRDRLRQLRGGSVAGDHTVLFLGEDERIELGHLAENRAIFASGAVRAAEWLLGQPRGALHDGRGARALNKADTFEFFRRLGELNPHPETELESGNVYQLLVAVVLSAQATDVGVNKATRKLFAEVETPAQMVALGEEALKQHIKTIGLFNTKAKNVIALSEILVRDYGGEVPTDRDALVELPGVGRKTANVVMNIAFGAETFAVDTHIFRVGNRTGLAKGKTPLAVELGLEKKVPRPVPPRRAPLADPARPLRLQGAHARMLALSGGRFVRVQAQGAGARSQGAVGSFRRTGRSWSAPWRTP